MELPQIARSRAPSRRHRKVPVSAFKGKDNGDGTSSPVKSRLDLTLANVSRAGRRTRHKTPAVEKKGYFDPEADYDFESTDDEDEAKLFGEETTDKGVATYRQMCTKLGVIPVKNIVKQFGQTVVTLEELNLNHNELKAFFVAALDSYAKKKKGGERQQNELTQLELGGNKIGHRELAYLSDFAAAHKPLVSLLLNNCQLTTSTVQLLAEFIKRHKHIRKLDLSDNNLDDNDSPYIADIIENCENLRELVLRRNKLGDSGRILGEALAKNDTIRSLDLSWNHIRASGALGFALGLKNNNCLETLILAWNGFGYEGCAALGHALMHNTTLSYLDLTCNRIHPPALFELLKGVEKNKSLQILKLGFNPITAPMSSILLSRLLNAKENNIKELDLEGIVVDKEFEGILKTLQENRLFLVRYDASLPLNKGVVTQVDPKNIFNIDPIRILYFMKEHLRTIDLFLKIDQDCSNGLTRDEMKFAFEMEGFPISSTALDQVMSYLDINKDGEVDLLCLKSKLGKEADCIRREFIEGERKLKRKLIKEREEEAEKAERAKSKETQFSQTFTPRKSPQKLPPVNTPK